MGRNIWLQALNKQYSRDMN